MTDFPNTTAPASASDLRAVALNALRTALARLRHRTRSGSARATSARPTLSSADAATHLHLRMCGAGQHPRI